MVRVVIGWIIMSVGAVPLVLLAVSWIDSFAGGNVVIYHRLLIIGGILFCVGLVIRGWGWRTQRLKNSSTK